MNIIVTIINLQISNTLIIFIWNNKTTEFK
jgi:hypothetical protein